DTILSALSITNVSHNIPGGGHRGRKGGAVCDTMRRRECGGGARTRRAPGKRVRTRSTWRKSAVPRKGKEGHRNTLGVDFSTTATAFFSSMTSFLAEES